jgi:hypothetical protein
MSRVKCPTSVGPGKRLSWNDERFQQLRKASKATKASVVQFAVNVTISASFTVSFGIEIQQVHTSTTKEPNWFAMEAVAWSAVAVIS